jgi:hypothetical protein
MKRLGLIATIVALFAAVSMARADSLSINFEPPAYVSGPIHGQNGWSSSGAVGLGCAMYDHKVHTNAGAPASFGIQSLRISDAATSGCFGDQTFSRSLLNEAGETTATNGGMSGGVRQTYFEAQWDFASTVSGAEQPGLGVVASPDRGDGARMSWVQMADTPTGLAVNFFDYQDRAPFGSTANLAAGCGAEDDFFTTTVASGLNRAVPHTIKVTMNLIDGPRNDVVQVYVDGVLRHTGTSWEDYFRYCEATNTSRTVDSILFRTGGTAHPANAGKGFLIDNLTYSSARVPLDKDECKDNGWRNLTRPDGTPFSNQGDCVSYANNARPSGNGVANGHNKPN